MRDNISEKNRGWLLPDSRNTRLKPGLYLIATPIGNLRDITVRALDTLAAVDCVLCEDTRVSGKLLAAYGMKKPLKSYNDHATQAQRERVLSDIEQGKTVALISDAGTPLVSDPGYKLVKACAEKSLYVTVVPGPSAVTAALQLSTMPSDAFSFIGFLPPKHKARQDKLKAWAASQGPLVAFETAPRLVRALGDIAAVFPFRKVAVLRELTKLYEQVRVEDVSDLVLFYEKEGAPKGEIVLVIAPPENHEYTAKQVKEALSLVLQTMPTKQAAEHVADLSGWKKKDVYSCALELRQEKD